MFLKVLTIVCFSAVGCMVIGYFRNEWVFRTQMRLIKEDYDMYQRLAGYNTMFWKMWSWNVKNFIGRKPRNPHE